MEAEVTTKTKNSRKTSDWKDTALSVGGRLAEIAATGLILGLTGSLGSRLMGSSSGPAQSKLGKDVEGASVTSIRKTGSV
jgi:hypothetical protein